jgi:PAS domain S-box-containing protein
LRLVLALRDRSITFKISAVILAVSSLTVLTACALFMTYQWSASRDALALRLQAMAQVVADQSLAAVEFSQSEQAVEILRSLRADNQVSVAALYDAKGTYFASYLAPGLTPTLVPAHPGKDGTLYHEGSLAIHVPLISESDRVGTLYLRTELHELWNQLLVNLVVGGLILAAALAVVVPISLKLGSIVSRPIRTLAQVVQSVSSTRDYSLRAELTGADEAGRLIAGFNDMIAQIQTRDVALAAARDDLEERVAARTGELQQEVLERRATELLLKEKDLLLTEAQDIAQLGSWEWVLVTDRVTWSDEVYRTYGLMPSRFAGDYASFVASAHPDDRPKLEAALSATRDSRSHCAVDYRIIRPDGAVRFVHVRGKVVLDELGRALRLVGTLQDITSRQEAELAMQKLNRELQSSMSDLAALNKELEGFSYSVSHDLRAPLRAIAGFSRMLVEDCGEVVPEQGRRYLDVIGKNVQKMSQLIDDLLAFSKLGRKPIQLVAVDMTKLAEEAAAECREATASRSVEILVSALPATRGDLAMLRQVWLNLVSNAVKYSRAKDHAVVKITSRAADSEVTYEVEDNGVGFDMAHVGKLFGVFQRLHAAKDFEGTGVGLALVQRIVERHGGRVWAEGAVGKGATFRFSLPIRAAAPAANTAAKDGQAVVS